MFIILKTVDEVELTCMSDIWDILVGYIRFFDNIKLSKCKIGVIKQISKDIYNCCEKKSIIDSKVEEFKKIINSKNDSKIISYYTDTIDFLQNYTVHKEILYNYKKNANKNGTDSLYEFLLKIGDVIRAEICYPQKHEGNLNRPHTKIESNNYEPLGKRLLECNQEEMTLSYSKIEEIIDPTKLPVNVKKDKLFWWDKETISSQSKACRENGYRVKNFDNKKEKVTFIRIASEFQYKDESSEETVKENKHFDGAFQSVPVNKCERTVDEFQYKDELSEETVKENKYFEGAFQSVLVNKYERNSKARQKCIDYYGYKCDICGFDFEKCYGEIGKNYIEVHHKVLLSEIKEQYEVDPINDLIPVCSNCHSIIHRRKTPSFKVEELKLIMKNNK